MKSKMTPGPWTRDGFGIWSHVNGENRRVACTEFDRGDGPYKVKTEAEAISNANAIALLPELVESLRDLLRADEMPPSEKQAEMAIEAMGRARAVLSKIDVDTAAQ